MTYRGRDYRNPKKYHVLSGQDHPTRSGPSPAVVAFGLAALTIAMGLACLLGSLGGGGF